MPKLAVLNEAEEEIPEGANSAEVVVGIADMIGIDTKSWFLSLFLLCFVFCFFFLFFGAYVVRGGNERSDYFYIMKLSADTRIYIQISILSHVVIPAVCM